MYNGSLCDLATEYGKPIFSDTPARYDGKSIFEVDDLDRDYLDYPLKLKLSPDMFDTAISFLPLNVVDKFMEIEAPGIGTIDPTSYKSTYTLDIANDGDDDGEAWPSETNLNLFACQEDDWGKYITVEADVESSYRDLDGNYYIATATISGTGLALIKSHHETSVYRQFFKDDSFTEKNWCLVTRLPTVYALGFQSNETAFECNNGYVPASIDQMGQVLKNIADRITVEHLGLGASSELYDAVRAGVNEFWHPIDYVEGSFCTDKMLITKQAKLFIGIRNLLNIIKISRGDHQLIESTIAEIKSLIWKTED